jgi:hypothetical protein
MLLRELIKFLHALGHDPVKLFPVLEDSAWSRFQASSLIQHSSWQ